MDNIQYRYQKSLNSVVMFADEKDSFDPFDLDPKRKYPEFLTVLGVSMKEEDVDASVQQFYVLSAPLDQRRIQRFGRLKVA